ncbi:uncharacterized protein LOC5515196 isoform X2 [Nematostella vectensis]|uniref:uncharacterized protein LOC5515196 isoform X2 n=1 Tax=Nematostella vectensis TaxID=45351 RepID=UPI00138FC8FE|nr:uncharacterized protein LOC5515196 isoform X2 [Nematostella vectensis]
MSKIGSGSFAESDPDSYGAVSDPIHHATAVTAFGKIKTFAGLEKDEWLFVIISTNNILFAIGLTIERLVNLPQNSTDYTFAIILFINTVFCLYYAIHGVLREREFEIYAYIAATAVLIIYIVLDLALNTSRPAVKWARFGLLVFFGPSNVYYGYKVVKGFGYLEFKTVGAAVSLQKMYRLAGIFSVLLKFDLQLAVSLLVLVIQNTTSLSLQEKLVVGIGVPVQVIWAYLGWIIMRREILNLVWVFLPWSFLEPGYLIYRTYDIIANWKSQDNSNILFYTFFGAAALALIIRVLVLVSLRFVVNNFGQGLREMVFALPVCHLGQN